MKMEGIDLEFMNEVIEYIVSIVVKVNKMVDNIGVRRLYIVFERIVEDLSFDVFERYVKFVVVGGKGELQVKIGVKDIDDVIGNMFK